MTVKRIGEWEITRGYCGGIAERDQGKRHDDVCAESDPDGLYVCIDNHAPYQSHRATALIPWPVIDELIRLRPKQEGGG